MRSALLVDVHDLYIGANKVFPGRVVNYHELLKSLSEDSNVMHRIAYGRQPEEKVRQFASMLRRHGFELSFQNIPHNVEMAIDALDLINSRACDKLILGSSHIETGRILKYAKRKGILTQVVGFQIPEIFYNYAEVIELDETMLQERPGNEATESLLVSSDLSESPVRSAAA